MNRELRRWIDKQIRLGRMVVLPRKPKFFINNKLRYTYPELKSYETT